jgi:hypothetical protein
MFVEVQVFSYVCECVCVSVVFGCVSEWEAQPHGAYGRLICLNWKMIMED